MKHYIWEIKITDIVIQCLIKVLLLVERSGLKVPARQTVAYQTLTQSILKSVYITIGK